MKSLLRLVSCFSIVLTGLVVAGSPPASADTVLEHGQVLPLSSYAAHLVDEARGRIYITAGRGDSRLAVTDLEGRPVQTVEELPGAGSMALSDDGTSLFVALETHRVVRLDADTLTTVQTYELPDFQMVTDLAWAGGRLWMAARSNCCTGTVSSLDPATGQRTPVTGLQGDDPVLTATSEGGVVVLMRSTEHVSLVDSASGAVVATRGFVDRVKDLASSSTGQPYALTYRYTDDYLVTLDPTTLETVRSTQVTTSSAVATDGMIAVSSTGDDFYDARGVDVRAADTSTRLNRYRLADGPDEYPVVLATILTSAGLVVAHMRSESMLATFVSDPSVQSSTIDLDLPQGAYVGREVTLSGTLTDRGAPIAGAAVRIVDEVAEVGNAQPVRSRTVTTGEDGTFSFPFTPRAWNDILTLTYAGDDLHPGAWQQAHGNFNLQPTSLSLDYPSSPAPGEAVTFTGTLSALGEPVPGAEIAVDHWCTDDPAVNVRTDEAGHFELTTTPGRCEADEYSFYYAASSTYDYLWTTRMVTPTWKDSSTTLVQPLESAAVGSTWTWNGKVMTEGVAAPDVPLTYAVWRTSTGTQVSSGTTRTDASGDFSITQTINEADRYKLIVRYAGDAATLESSASDEFQVTRIPTSVAMDDVEIAALPDEAITIGGRVTTGGGTALQDHPVEISLNGQVVGLLRTDTDGRFEFQTVPRPPEDSRDQLRIYVVDVVQDARYGGTQRSVRVTIAPEPTRVVLDHVPSRTAPDEAITVGGHLTTGDGEALTGRALTVSLRDGETRTFEVVTDEQGRFSVDTVTRTGYWQYLGVQFAGTRLLAASGASASWESTPLPGILTLEPVSTRVLGESIPLKGRLTDANGNGESSWITFRRIDELGQSDWSYDQLRTAADGSFSFDVPAEQVGRYTFTARSDLWRVAPQSDSIVVRIRRLELASTALRPDAVVRGWSVYDAGRDPVVRSTASPQRNGLCLGHELQRLRDGSWRPVTTYACTDTNDAGVVREQLDVRHPAGSRFRIRAVRDAATRTVGAWERVRFR